MSTLYPYVVALAGGLLVAIVTSMATGPDKAKRLPGGSISFGFGTYIALGGNVVVCCLFGFIGWGLFVLFYQSYKESERRFPLTTQTNLPRRVVTPNTQGHKAEQPKANQNPEKGVEAWECEFCNTLNATPIGSCTNCQASLAGSRKVLK